MSAGQKTIIDLTKPVSDLDQKMAIEKVFGL
jgi:hypothetical protein